MANNPELEILRDNLAGELNARQAATREAFTGALMQLVPAGVALGSWLKMRRDLARTAAQFRNVVTQMQPDSQPADDPAGYAETEPEAEREWCNNTACPMTWDHFVDEHPPRGVTFTVDASASELEHVGESASTDPDDG